MNIQAYIIQVVLINCFVLRNTELKLINEVSIE